MEVLKAVAAISASHPFLIAVVLAVAAKIQVRLVLAVLAVMAAVVAGVALELLAAEAVMVGRD